MNNIVTVNSLGTVSYLLSIAITITMALSCIISEISEILVENRDFFHTLLAFDVPVKGHRRNIAIPFGVQKLE